ncbi:methylated-DNA-[protein]-cysteine S-methyltransferase [Facklamia miroungae]|uniref:methylated-DNA--[protein]-cysteine S-methyltransferase n=2 Tax=Facklamia miroungae TaxID=120956 RepID=A0A1G7QJU4_9LACT|nr:methylated-DNA-[protein]-cysteine S-methyltransferase [Facklamia miroungae]
MLLAANYNSPIGEMRLLIEKGALTALWFRGKGQIENKLSDKYQLIASTSPEFAPIIRWLDDYFQGQRFNPIQFELKPLFQTTFRQQVWRKVAEIPYGQLTTYGEITHSLQVENKRTVSPQAVGGALAANPILLIIPCHRVLSATGDLAGYNGGIANKAWLIEHEKKKSNK